MSRRNREKRAAKQKARRRGAAERTAGIGSDRVLLRAIVTAAIHTATACQCGRSAEEHAADLLDDFGQIGWELDDAADEAVADAVRGAWEAGWMPLDVHEHARRTLATHAAGYLAEAVVVESRRYAPAMVHPRWRAGIASVAATLSSPMGLPHLREWSARAAVGRAASLAVVLEALAMLASLPVLERLVSLPGESRHRVGVNRAVVDEKALAKVRALLAKAESTGFPEEAEALSAKAQELMSRHSLHQAVLDHDHGRTSDVAGRRLWMDKPYAGAKALLVQSVATANRCRAVWSENLGFVTIVGAGSDLDSVELLTTSLLVQANRAMLVAGRQQSRSGRSRTRSFRQSFLVAYATRIGERLGRANAAATTEMQADSRLLPVLAARSQEADQVIHRLFPRTTQRSFSVSNAAGWGAGLAAADLAMFDVQRSIAG